MPENVLQITIEDTGIGIPNDKLSAIFEPFSQVDTSTTRSYGGTGLGLAIVRNLLEQMGGHITVQSELGIGSIFILQVPLQKDCFAPGPVVDYASTQSESS